VVSSPTVVVVADPCCEPVRSTKLAKLPPWQVRRLERIADRQEAREIRKCCCEPCACDINEACKCNCRTVVVESRR
jgi:hypothetical protein